jgi:L-lysine exporter family protein LysE/ArgO
MIAFVNGFSVCMGLIISIGPQNMELLRSGFLRQKSYLLASIFVFCDILLILMGILGLAELVSLNPFIETILTACALIILVYLAICAFNRAKNLKTLEPHLNDIIESSVSKPTTYFSTIKKGLFLSILNPLAILETVVIIGSTANQYQGNKKIYFAIGAMLASTIWFYSFAYSATQFSTFFTNPKKQKILEMATGIILMSIAMWLALNTLLQ